jgi:hypothetical protein
MGSASRAVKASSSVASAVMASQMANPLLPARTEAVMRAKVLSRKARWLGELTLLVGLLGLVGAATASAAITSATIDGAILGAGQQTVRVTGTITCTAGESWVLNGIQVIQGQKIVAGGPAVAEGGTCTGSPQPYTAVAALSGSKLVHHGRTSVSLNFFSVDPVTGVGSGFFVDGFVML